MESVQERGDRDISRKRRQTQARLLDAAYEIFVRDGVGAASVDEIAERAGFTRGAFYSNFASKTELFARLAMRENDRRLSQARAGANAVGELRLVRKEQLDDASGYHAMVERVVDEFLGWQNEDRDWLVIEQEIRLLAMRDEEFGRYLLGYHGVVCEGLQRILTEALGRNGLRFTIDDTSAVRIALAVYTESNVQRAMGAAEEDIRLRDKLVFLIEAITEPVSPGRVE